jgi:tripartite-type tricarboxylate transporter receptor subunit TctC
MGLLSKLGIDPTAIRWVPSEGAAPGLQELVAGGVDVVPCSIPEARSLIDAGRVRPLAVMSSQRNEAFPDVPSTEEIVGASWEIGAWRGIVGPAGLPEDVTAELIAALEKVYDSPAYADFMSKQGFGRQWAAGPEFATFMKDSDDSLGAVMTEVGLAK